MSSEGRGSVGSGRVGWLVLAGILVVAGVAVYAFWQPTRPPEVGGEIPDPPDPRLAYKGQYRNIHPDVKYVGSKACADCHLEIAARFAKHPMGRSIIPMKDAVERQPSFEGVKFDALGRRFWLSRIGLKTFHHVAAYHGEEKLYEQVLEAKFVIGSGTHSYSYLVERDGHVLQSPISYYSGTGRWGLSPSFREEQVHGRVVPGACLQCHANGLKFAGDDNDRFKPGVFEGHAIGCERCHGPGETHVRERERGDPIEVPHDTATVNPARLSPHLRDSVCEQCHLQADGRILRYGRGLMDFRPGLPVEEFVNAFVIPGPGDDRALVGHFEEMHLSKCHQASAGKMGCISCHDPHYKPGPGEKAEFFRERCNRCHEGEGKTACSERAAAREAKGNSCIACHMPAQPTKEMAHMILTDHRVLRKPGGPSRRVGRITPLGEGVRSFYEGRIPADSIGMRRDLSIALSRLVRSLPPQEAEGAAKRIWANLEEAVVAHPRDHVAWATLAHTRQALGDLEGAKKAMEQALALRPDDEQMLLDMASLHKDKPTLALPYLRRVSEVAPQLARSRRLYVTALTLSGEWHVAAEQARGWVDLAPGNIEARVALCEALAMSGRVGEARKEFSIIRKLKPANLPGLESRLGHLLGK